MTAFPAAIHRRAGRFIIILANLNPSDADAAFAVIPEVAKSTQPAPSVSSAAQASEPLQTAPVPVPTPILKLGGAGINDYKHRSASIFDAPAGTYDLVYATTGKVFCRITID